MTDHVHAEILNTEDVARFFDNKGYKIKKLEQKWRHVTGVVLFENEKLFLKLASTTGISERTRNESSFNVNANSFWKKSLKSFKTPKIFDDGEYEGKYWFISEFVFGKTLADLTLKNSNILLKDLEKSAEIASEIMSLSDHCILPKDKEHFKDIWKIRMLAVSKDWAKNIKHNTKSIIQFIEENMENLEIASSHGDFVPWSIYKTKEKDYYLVDNEAAQIAGPKYYDAAYFYHRVYTKLKRPDLAEKFLHYFKEIENWNKNKEKSFNLVLASRIVGGYFDAERDSLTSIKLNEELEKILIKQPPYGG